jgi:hypothetical protein
MTSDPVRHSTLRVRTLLAVVWLLTLVPAASAAVEQDDAGDLPATAQDLTGQPVERIDGVLADPSDIDMYRLCLDGGGSFSASAVGGTSVDTQLFLFDSAGRGVYANDDDEDGVLQSRLPSRHALTPRSPGEYLLAIGAYNLDPLGAGGPIFPGDPGILGPTGPGGSDPVVGWSGRPGVGGAYTLSLTGARCDPGGADTTPPSVELLSPLDGAVYLLDDDVRADYACADEEGGSGLALCAAPVADGAIVDTGSVGEREFTVAAADAAGNSASVTARFRVVYDFEGFLWPVRNRPRVNGWVAGVPVPIRFEVDGGRGADVIEEGWPQVAAVGCDFADEPEGGEPARSTRRRRKRRHAFVWKTDRRWAGSCRQFMLKLKDGTVKRADFRFVGRRRHEHDDD